MARRRKKDPDFDPDDLTEIKDVGVRQALSRIAQADPDGLIQPVAVVEAARNPRSPLHKYIFRDDDATAAEAYRLVLARNLIRRVRIDVVERAPELLNVKVRLGTPEERRGYAPFGRILLEPELAEQVVAEARRVLAHQRDRLSRFNIVKAKRAVSHLNNALRELDR